MKFEFKKTKETKCQKQFTIMKIKFCPKCKSENIAYKPATLEAAWGLQATYKCEECGYKSIAFP